jgi:hypothetical protein
MSERADIPHLERIAFFTGQRLTAADLTEVVRVDRELRWLHNRALHAWGIGIGFAVTGERGDSAVTIGPGFGVDALGREIILGEERTKTIPAVAAAPDGGEVSFYLVAAYRPDADQAVAERRPGVCLPEGTVRLSEDPLLDWRPSNRLRPGTELVLAQVWVQNCRLSRAVSLAARRYARPPQQPYIAAGQTRAGATAWQPWRRGPRVVGVSTVVDTSAARFQSTPRYVAHVAGERFLPAAAGGPGPLLALGAAAVEAATPNGFEMQVLLPGVPSEGTPVNPDAVRDPALAPAVAAALGWHVVWMGVEG